MNMGGPGLGSLGRRGLWDLKGAREVGADAKGRSVPWDSEADDIFEVVKLGSLVKIM